MSFRTIMHGKMKDMNHLFIADLALKKLVKKKQEELHDSIVNDAQNTSIDHYNYTFYGGQKNEPGDQIDPEQSLNDTQ